MNRQERLETMRTELFKQKDVIEKSGGLVTVKKKHPTPQEITEGIGTLANVDFSLATATEEDVSVGKTFFAGNSLLKTGTALVDAKQINSLFMYNPSTLTAEDEAYFTIPSNITTLKKYTFYQNANNIVITFNENLTEIGDYAFYETSRAKFYNFNNLTSLKTIGSFAFTRSWGEGIDVARLPDSIKTLNGSCFANVPPASLDYRFPDNLSALGQSVLKQDYRKEVNSLDLSNYKLSSLPSYTFHNVGFNCDLVLPSTVTTIAMYFNQNGSFNNITIPSTCTNLQSECFGAYATYANSDYRLKTVTFESETPPTCGNKPFATQCLNNNFKIYVPDNVLDEYKAVGGLKYCADYIYPMSQKE